MKKNSSENPFPEPSRQDPAAIFIQIVDFVRKLVIQFFPVLLVFFFAGSGRIELIFLVFALATGVISIFLSILHYFRFYFHVQKDALIISKGLLNRTHSSIPFDRIQVINFEASVIHRTLNVVKVVVETAGSKSSESEISAMKKADAIAMRDYLLAMKEEVGGEDSVETDELTMDGEIKTSGYAKSVFSLGIIDLIKIGITNNHLKTAWAIVALVGYYISQYWVYFDDPEELPFLGSFIGLFDSLVLSFVVVSVVGLLAIAVLLSVIITIIRHYGLNVVEVKGGLKVSAGLFNQREYSARNNKLQIFYWNTNPFRKLAGIYSATMSQASSEDGLGSQSINIPGCNDSQVAMLRDQFFGDVSLEPNIIFKPDKRIMGRYFIFFGIIPISALFFGLYLWFDSWFFEVFLLLPAVFLMIWIFYKKFELRLTDEVLFIKTGIIEDVWKLIFLYKVQSIQLSQTPYMQQRDLVNLRFYTAAGSVSIPYIALEEAKTIRDFVLYKVESTRKSWI